MAIRGRRSTQRRSRPSRPPAENRKENSARRRAATTRRRLAALRQELPLFDHYGWALRLVQKVRAGATVEEAVASAKQYARDVRDLECTDTAGWLVGRSAVQIRKNCPVPLGVIRQWQASARDLGSGRELTDRKLANFLSAMYKDVRGAQVAEAARLAGAQAAKAKARHNNKQATLWRRTEANLEAMRQSIVEGGFVPIPYPPKESVTD